MDDGALSDQRSSYRQIFKATSLFGGVQLFNILIAIARSKIIAVLLGPTGMGVAGLLTATVGLISGLTSFGLGVAAVKNVAAANTSGNSQRIATIVIVLRRLVWITGLLGMLVTLILSPWLSQLTFGNHDYTMAFAWLSVTLLFSQISSGQRVILQGMRKLQYLAQANMAGAVFGLFISVPIYYFWGIDGIVPAIILSSLFAMIISWHFARKVPIQKVKVSRQTTLIEGKDMLQMGVMFSLSGLIATGTAYIMRVFIGNEGGIEQVGLYTAGFAIINTYVGMIFTAMGTDYYPRLAGVSRNNVQARDLISQQAEVAILIIAPILTIFLVFIDQGLILLYSREFLAVNGMIQWAALGMYFKAVSWAIGYILLAKGASKLFFWSELSASLYILGFNIIGYKLAGLNGLGFAFLASYVVYFLQIFLISKIKYEFKFEKNFYQVFGVQILLGVSCFVAVNVLDGFWFYAAGLLFIILSTLYSLYKLENRLDLKLAVNTFLQKLGLFEKQK